MVAVAVSGPLRSMWFKAAPKWKATMLFLHWLDRLPAKDI